MGIRELLENDEGLKFKPYRDTRGKLTIGVGRNLEDVGISREEAMQMLDNDIAYHDQDLKRDFPWYKDLSEPRAAVVLSMAFNLGEGKIQDFKHFLDALAAHDYERAAKEMLDSTWATQVGDRATRLAQMMREDRFLTETS